MFKNEMNLDENVFSNDVKISGGVDPKTCDGVIVGAEIGAWGALSTTEITLVGGLLGWAAGEAVALTATVVSHVSN